MSDPKALAVGAVEQLAKDVGIEIDPVMVEQLGEFLVGALFQDKWATAVNAGLSRAARVKDVASAEAAAVERNRT